MLFLSIALALATAGEYARRRRAREAAWIAAGVAELERAHGGPLGTPLFAD